MNIFITGSSRGIGKEIKNYFEKNNHNVYSPTRSDLLLGDHEKIDDFLKNFKHEIDILINNAGITEAKLIENIETDDLQLINDINFLSHFKITKYFLNKFTERNFGRIVNIGSVRTKVLKPGRLSYSLSKENLHMLTKYIVLEYSHKNILCNTVSPGYVLSDMLNQNNSKDALDKMLHSIPLKKFCSPEEIAKICYFLTVENNYITGQNIFIDGGLSSV